MLDFESDTHFFKETKNKQRKKKKKKNPTRRKQFLINDPDEKVLHLSPTIVVSNVAKTHFVCMYSYNCKPEKIAYSSKIFINAIYLK